MGCGRTGILRELADQFMKDFMASMDRAKKCFPHAQLYCVRTHPVLATDERNPQYASKRPHVVAAVNSAVREVSTVLAECSRSLGGKGARTKAVMGVDGVMCVVLLFKC
jgi:hypothetical protein